MMPVSIWKGQKKAEVEMEKIKCTIATLKKKKTSHSYAKY